MISERIKSYIRGRSKLNLLGDALFAILIVLLLIPGPRRAILSGIVRVISTQPTRVDQSPITLTDNDYEWSFTDEDGILHSFSELKGEVVLLNHWATWCHNCIAEFPSMQELYDDYGDRVTFLFLTYEEPQLVKDFMARRSLNLPVYFGKGSIPGTLDTRSLPRTYIISADGRIHVDKTGAAKWNGDRTRELLDELLASEQ